jgi:hypothetical protein
MGKGLLVCSESVTQTESNTVSPRTVVAYLYVWGHAMFKWTYVLLQAAMNNINVYDISIHDKVCRPTFLSEKSLKAELLANYKIKHS